MGKKQEIVQEPVNQDVSPDGWTLSPFQAIPAVIVEGVLHGKPFQKGLPIRHGDSELRIPQERRVGVVVSRDGLNDDVFIPAKDAPIISSDFPEAPLAKADTLFDGAEEGSPSLQTARGAGASTVFVDADAKILADGGDPDHRIEQQDHSFAYKPGS